MTSIKPLSIQKHPLILGWIWAALTLALLSLLDYVRGEPLPNLLIEIPIFAILGAAWGYSVKWLSNREAHDSLREDKHE